MRPNIKIYSPPQAPITDSSWQAWFNNVLWPVIGKGLDNSGPQGTFPQLQVGNARFTNENQFQELLNVDQGLYVTYSSTVQNIIYGFACNVHRSGGGSFVVGAQINAYGEPGSTGAVYGIACTAIAQPQSGSRGLTAFEPDIGSLCDANTAVKWCINAVFKNRPDGATNAPDGLTSNFYNYQAIGLVFTSQPRSGLGEYCGWTVGVDFLDGWCDQASVQVWNSATSYVEGDIVSSGGVLWKAIVFNTNVTPAVGTTWVQRTYSGTANLAVGIDFSSMGLTAMANMASAIRLRSSQYVHWEETGSVGTKFDANTSILHLCDNQTSLVFGVDVGTGVVSTSQSSIGLGGGATATLGTIGASGPASAAQVGWEKVVLNGSTYYRPLWQ